MLTSFFFFFLEGKQINWYLIISNRCLFKCTFLNVSFPSALNCRDASLKHTDWVVESSCEKQPAVNWSKHYLVCQLWSASFSRLSVCKNCLSYSFFLTLNYRCIARVWQYCYHSFQFVSDETISVAIARTLDGKHFAAALNKKCAKPNEALVTAWISPNVRQNSLH